MSSTISPRVVAERVGLDANELDKPCQDCSLPLMASFVHPWRLVFSHLLTEVELDDVDSENAGQPEELKRLGCLRKWKGKNGAEATFKLIVQAAISSGRVDNAEAICRQLQRRETGTSLTSSSIVKVTDEAKSKEVREKIGRLERQFLDMQRRLQSELKTLSPETLVDSLTFLPIALRAEYQKFVYDNLEALERAESIRKMFHHINPLITFIDYGLLNHLIEEFGSYRLKQEMSTYSEAVEGFLNETTVEQLSHHWPGVQDIPPHFERLTAVIDEDPFTFTLRQLDDLRKRFCCEIRLYKTILVLIGVGKKNSFRVTWILPAIFVSELKSTIGTLTSFYKAQSFLSVTVGKHRLYSIAAKYEERLLVLCSEGSRSGQASEMLSLLKMSGVETNIYDKDGRTPLWWSSECGRTDLVQLLLDHGAEVDLPNDDEWGETPLLAACFKRHLTTATLLIEKGAYVDYQNEKGHHPLYYAGFYGHLEIATLLLDSGARIDLPTNNHLGFTALQTACQEGKKDIALLLIERGANIEYLTKGGRAPIHTASQFGHVSVVQLLIDKGAKIDQPSEDHLGATPLNLASEGGHPAVVRVLIDKGAKVDGMSKIGITPLHLASQNGYDVVVNMLLDEGAIVDTQSKDEFGITALQLACYQGHTKVATTLINRGADVNLKRKNGWTPLLDASTNGRTEIVELLVSHGAQLDIRNEEGRTALSIASWKGHTDIVRILSERRANMDVQDEAGLTPLILATRKGHSQIVKLLLKSKANPNITDIKVGSGWSPAFFSAEQGQLEILRELVGAGANVLLKDKNGNTPLDVAKIHGHNDVSDFLQEYSDSEKEKEITEDQKKQVKSTSQRLKNVLNLLVHSLLKAKVTKEEKQKIAREREILEHTQYQNQSKGHDRVY